MIVPSAKHVLAIVERTLEESVVPDATSTSARSALATIGHLLRHVQLRLEQEGQILSDDIAALRALLPDMADWLAGADQDVAPLRATLARRFREEGRYPDLGSLGEEAGALRHALTDALGRMVALRDDAGTDEAYKELRSRARAYLASQIQAEAALVDPAFAGKGPRR